MTTPEGKVKAAVRKLLASKGIWYFMPVPSGYGVAGVPDFVCCWRGRFLAIETKAPGRLSTLTNPQKAQIAAINEANGLTIVVDDVSQVAQFLEEHDDQVQSRQAAVHGRVPEAA